MDKRGAYEFLTSMQHRLSVELPPPNVVREYVNQRWIMPKAEKSPQNQLACKENIFLYHLALPLIFDHVSIQGLGPESARRSLLCEYYSKFPQFSAANARRRPGHPFGKSLGATAGQVMASWKKPAGAFPLNQAYRDLCLSAPFPHKIVFDAKFFESESLSAAEQALVAGVYEAVFYRGLPSDSVDGSNSRWAYDFGCLLAYDASSGGYLQEAWGSVASKRLFWDDANVFVMIVRGPNTA